jgi:hypothetical protein
LSDIADHLVEAEQVRNVREIGGRSEFDEFVGAGFGDERITVSITGIDGFGIRALRVGNEGRALLCLVVNGENRVGIGVAASIADRDGYRTPTPPV